MSRSNTGRKRVSARSVEKSNKKRKMRKCSGSGKEGMCGKSGKMGEGAGVRERVEGCPSSDYIVHQDSGRPASAHRIDV